MKSISLMIIFCMIGVINADAQTSNFSIGPKVGINFSNINNDNTDNKLGYNLGLTTTYSVNETSGIGLDILYSNQGYKISDLSTHINYLKVPITYKLFFNKLGDPFRPRIELGLSPAFLLSAKTQDINIKDQLNGFDVGLLGGLGFNYRISNRMWFNFDLRGDIGLTDISKDTNDKSKNRVTSINIGIAVGM